MSDVWLCDLIEFQLLFKLLALTLQRCKAQEQYQEFRPDLLCTRCVSLRRSNMKNELLSPELEPRY